MTSILVRGVQASDLVEIQLLWGTNVLDELEILSYDRWGPGIHRLRCVRLDASPIEPPTTAIHPAAVPQMRGRIANAVRVARLARVRRIVRHASTRRGPRNHHQDRPPHGREGTPERALDDHRR